MCELVLHTTSWKRTQADTMGGMVLHTGHPVMMVVVIEGHVEAFARVANDNADMFRCASI